MLIGKNSKPGNCNMLLNEFPDEFKENGLPPATFASNQSREAIWATCKTYTPYNNTRAVSIIVDQENKETTGILLRCCTYLLSISLNIQ